MKKSITTLLAGAMLLPLCLTSCAAVREGGGEEESAIRSPQIAAIAETSEEYSDIPTGAWFADAVTELTEQGIMNGTGEGRFSPNDTLDRAMIATILYRVVGEPAVSGADGFSDTQPGQWYSDAVLWTNQTGLIKGYGNGLFGIGDPVTQEQLVTILWRQAGEPEVTDRSLAQGVDEWYADGVNWAKSNRVVSEEGYTFDHAAPASRAQVAVILRDYLAVTQAKPTAQKGDDDTTIHIPQTGWTQAVPAEYMRAASHQGTVERLDYDTKDYVRDEAPIQKAAYVYLPYGYDAADSSTRYDIVYLMHGWGGSAGEYFNMASLKNVFDNLIEKGDMKPIILVSATFYNANSDRDFSSSIQEFRQFHRDFEEALMPAVEGKYHTYAKSTSGADLKASRDHRAFGGFSLGSVTTWLEFCYDYDYIRYFLPMSGSSWYYGTYGDFRFANNVDFIENLVKEQNLDERGYYIYHAVGTNDTVKSQSINMAEEMLSREIFTPDHYVFYQKDGGYHDFNAVQEYLYNALPLFFRDGAQKEGEPVTPAYTTASKVSEVIHDPAFGTFGRLLVPANSGYWSGDTLGSLRLTWYSGIDPDKTVEIVNTLKARAEAGETVFYDIYTEAEKAADPAKRDTGLFFFKGEPGAKFAVCNAGGGFSYVGAMHDSFPHALELSKKGYNAFALIYRPGWETAMEDLGRAISFIIDHADELEVDPDDYSLWGGSAGARMAATLGNTDYLRQYTGRTDIPQAAAVIMQYTGHSEASAADAPTYACCGTSDGIANYRTMENRLSTLTSRYGIPTEFHAYPGLPHGFGLGTGTVAEGWLNDAVAFWESQM